jgi:hypothetical protein
MAEILLRPRAHPIRHAILLGASRDWRRFALAGAFGALDPGLRGAGGSGGFAVFEGEDELGKVRRALGAERVAAGDSLAELGFRVQCGLGVPAAGFRIGRLAWMMSRSMTAMSLARRASMSLRR